MTKLIFPLVLMTSLASGEAAAQCTKDTDCKGNRICVAGRCQNPPAGFAAAPPTPATVPPGPADPGWAQGAGIFGFIAGAVVLGMSVAAEVVGTEDPDFGIILGAAGTGMLAISGPIVGIGAASARADPRVSGSWVCRLVGWSSYGTTISLALVAVALAASDVEIPQGIPSTLGVMGLSALINLSLDAIWSAADARKLAPSPAPVSWMPTVTPLPLSRGGGVVVGLAARF